MDIAPMPLDMAAFSGNPKLALDIVRIALALWAAIGVRLAVEGAIRYGEWRQKVRLKRFFRGTRR